MEAKNISLSLDAISAIEALQHKNGTYRFYADTLGRLFNYILEQSDEIGMDATEAIETLRVLKCIKTDLQYIAGEAVANQNAATAEEIAIRIDETFSDYDDIQEDTPIDQPEQPKNENAKIEP